MAPHPESGIRKTGRHIPSRSLKDLWKMRERCGPPVGDRSMQASEHVSSETALSLAATDVRFGYLGSSFSSFGRGDGLGSTGSLSRSRTLRNPNVARRNLGFTDKHAKTSTSIGWQPGNEGAEWSTAIDVNNGRTMKKNGIKQSPVTNYIHNQKMTGMENAMRLIL
jgi:hypothetical protein